MIEEILPKLPREPKAPFPDVYAPKQYPILFRFSLKLNHVVLFFLWGIYFGSLGSPTSLFFFFSLKTKKKKGEPVGGTLREPVLYRVPSPALDFPLSPEPGKPCCGIIRRRNFCVLLPVMPDPTVYFESELLPGRPMFRCAKLAASLQVSRCASMWTEANARHAPDRLDQCRGCTIGARHAGAVEPAYHRLRGTTTCARCHRTDLRLIGGSLCVSCKNREYEWVNGRNRRGKFPMLHPAMARRRLTVLIGGKVRVVARELTTSSLELVVELLRDAPERVVFGLGRGRVYGST